MGVEITLVGGQTCFSEVAKKKNTFHPNSKLTLVYIEYINYIFSCSTLVEFS